MADYLITNSNRLLEKLETACEHNPKTHWCPCSLYHSKVVQILQCKVYKESLFCMFPNVKAYIHYNEPLR